MFVSLSLQNWVDEVLRSELLVGRTSAATSSFSCAAKKEKEKKKMKRVFIT
jgi:hypothetical protein